MSLMIVSEMTADRLACYLPSMPPRIQNTVAIVRRRNGGAAAGENILKGRMTALRKAY